MTARALKLISGVIASLALLVPCVAQASSNLDITQLNVAPLRPPGRRESELQVLHAVLRSGNPDHDHPHPSGPRPVSGGDLGDNDAEWRHQRDHAPT